MTMNVKAMAAVAVLGAAGAGAWWLMGSSANTKTDVFSSAAKKGSATTAVSQTTANTSGASEATPAGDTSASAPAWLKPAAATNATATNPAQAVPGMALPNVPGVAVNADPAERAKEMERLQRVRAAALNLREVSMQKNPDPKAVVEAMKALEVANGGPMMNGIDLAAMRKSNELLLNISSELQSMQSLAERVERGDKTIPEAEYKAHLEKMRKLHEQMLANAPAVPAVPAVPKAAKTTP